MGHLLCASDLFHFVFIFIRFYCFLFSYLFLLFFRRVFDRRVYFHGALLMSQTHLV